MEDSGNIKNKPVGGKSHAELLAENKRFFIFSYLKAAMVIK